MKNTDWKAIAEIIGLAAIVASLVFVGLQMQQDQEIAIADTYSSPAESAGTLASLVSEYPNIWRRGLDGEELSPDDELRFRALVQAVETHFFNMFLRYFRLGIDDPSKIARNYAFAIHNHPGLRRVYLASKDYQASRDAALSTDQGIGPFRTRVDTFLVELGQSGRSDLTLQEYVFW